MSSTSRFIPPPSDLVKPIDAIKEYGKTLVAAGDPRECWRLIEYLFELPFLQLIDAPAPLALLEPKQTPRKVLQAARRLKDAVATVFSRRTNVKPSKRRTKSSLTTPGSHASRG